MENPDLERVGEAPDLECVGDRRRTYPDEEALDLPSNQPIVLGVWFAWSEMAVKDEGKWIVDTN